MIAGPITPRPQVDKKPQQEIQPVKPVVKVQYAIIDYRRPPGQRLDVKV